MKERIYGFTRSSFSVRVCGFGSKRTVRKEFNEDTQEQAVKVAYAWAEKTAKAYARRTGGTAVYTTVPDGYYRAGMDKTCWLVR